MKAKAAVFMGAHKDFEVREFEITAPPKGYGQMELIASGICGTDLHFHNGKLAIQPPPSLATSLLAALPTSMKRRAKNSALPRAITLSPISPSPAGSVSFARVATMPTA